MTRTRRPRWLRAETVPPFYKAQQFQKKPLKKENARTVMSFPGWVSSMEKLARDGSRLPTYPKQTHVVRGSWLRRVALVDEGWWILAQPISILHGFCVVSVTFPEIRAREGLARGGNHGLMCRIWTRGNLLPRPFVRSFRVVFFHSWRGFCRGRNLRPRVSRNRGASSPHVGPLSG